MLVTVLMAGGRGTRFWPASRQNNPKQFLPIVGKSTMLQQAYQLVKPLTPPEQTLIITGADLVKKCRAQLPDIPPRNIIGEPEGRNTAPCAALAAFIVRERFGEDAVIQILSADHHFKDKPAYRRILKNGAKLAAKEDILVTFGIVPDRPDVGYGYLEVGATIATIGSTEFSKVNRFAEKPNQATANRYFKSGKYLWNSGNFMWRCDTVLAAFKEHKPEMYNLLNRNIKKILASGGKKVLARVFPKLEAISVDYAIMEKSSNVVTTPVDVGWDDVGSWLVMERHTEADEQGNTASIAHFGVDTKNCIIAGEGGMVATIGLEDMVVVKIDDAVFVAPKERLDEIKTLLTEMGKDDFFKKFL